MIADEDIEGLYQSVYVSRAVSDIVINVDTSIDNPEEEFYEDETEEEVAYRQELARSYESIQKILTEEELKFVSEKFGSKLWRMDNLYTIRDKNNSKKIMKLNDSQRTVLTKYRHNRKIILKSRQQGISTLFLAYYLDDCITKAGFQAGIQSYGREESEKLAQRALLMWDELDPNIKSMLGIELVYNNSKGMTFSNGSILKIGNFRGDTLQGLHVSELAKIALRYPEKAKELKTGAFQAVGKDNKITIESTAETKSGLFYDMWVRAYNKVGKKLGKLDFEAIFLSWIYDGDCSLSEEESGTVEITRADEVYFGIIEKALGVKLGASQKRWYVAKKEELGDDIKKEYPSTPEEAFEQSVEGTYYGEEYKKLKLTKESHIQGYKVHRFVDLGMNDTFVLGFFIKKSDGTIRIIHCYSNNHKGLSHYQEVCEALSVKYGWVLGSTYVPHDVSVRELIADKTRWDAMEELGFNPILVEKHGLLDGIETTRKFLKHNEIYEGCEDILIAIQSYRKKYDRTYDVFLNSPVHDQYSHPADALRYLAMGDKHSPIQDIYANYDSYGSSSNSSYDDDFDV